jgi:putative nucleotidyltransferase with HDIG domain
MTRAEICDLLDKLPVFPVCAAEVIRLARAGLSTEQLVALALSDQVLAGGLIKAANSAEYTWSGTVGTIQKAVLYLGEVRGTQVLLSTAIKPILAVVGHTKLSDHSLEVADVAVRLASAIPDIGKADAYVLGLFHDVGELVFKVAAPQELAERVEELVAAGADRLTAEHIVYGVTHAQAGADVLRRWGMPDEYVQAVELHHTPELTFGHGAALLYLAEQWTDANGDLLCERRLKHALNVLHLKWEDFSDHSIARRAMNVENRAQ